MVSADPDAPYLALRRQLLERLLSGQFPAGSRFHSVREVADWPGATGHLAQRALSELCREGYLESVPKKGLFVRDVTRRRPRRPAARAGAGRAASAAAAAAAAAPPPAAAEAWRRLLLIVPVGSNRTRVLDLLHHVDGVFDTTVWRVEIVYLKDGYLDDGGFRFADGLLARAPSAAVWLMPLPQDQMMIRYLVTHGLPLVTYNRDYTATGAFGVVADVADVARAMFDRLWDAGRRRFLMLAIDRPSPTIRQFPGVALAAARARGAAAAVQVDLHYEEEGFPDAAAHAAVDAAMAEVRPDAVMAAESFSLLAIEHWLARHPDVRVPRDLAVASFDRLPVWHVLRVLPAIPRADFDHDGMMAAAMRMIDAELAGRRVEQRLAVVAATELPLDDENPAPAPAVDKGSPQVGAAAAV